MVGHLAQWGERRGTYRVMVRKRERKRPLGRYKHKWEHNIKLDIQEVGWGTWTQLSWHRTGSEGELL